MSPLVVTGLWLLAVVGASACLGYLVGHRVGRRPPRDNGGNE